MKIWTEELAQVEAAALRVEALEQEAEKRFEMARQEAVARGDGDAVVRTPEFSAWMAARHETDAAWGRWAQVMDAAVEDKHRD